MLRLLLDAHVAKAVVNGLHNQIPVEHLADWAGGQYREEDDPTILRIACQQRLTLVTYDLRTIIPLLRAWGERGEDHGGAIFVDDKTIPPTQYGTLIDALKELWFHRNAEDWTNQTTYLKRASP